MSEKKDSVFNILTHELVPKMEILSEKQKEAVLKKLEVTQELLPKIFSTDPAVVALGAKAGDLIKIHRKDLTATYDYYRLVV